MYLKDVFGSVFLKNNYRQQSLQRHVLLMTSFIVKLHSVQPVSLIKCQEASLGNLPGGTWVFLGWVCTTRDSKFGPALERICPKFDMVSQFFYTLL